MRSLFFIVCLLATAQLTPAQNFVVPAHIDLSKEENFKQYEQDIVKAENWLENNPVDKDAAKRKEVSSFIIEWLSGCPYISMSINAQVLPFAESSPEMLIYFMGGWGKYAIEHPKDTNVITGTTAGLQSVIKVYKDNSSVKRDENIDKIVALNKEGKLEKWVSDQLK